MELRAELSGHDGGSHRFDSPCKVIILKGWAGGDEIEIIQEEDETSITFVDIDGVSRHEIPIEVTPFDYEGFPTGEEL